MQSYYWIVGDRAYGPTLGQHNTKESAAQEIKKLTKMDTLPAGIKIFGKWRSTQYGIESLYAKNLDSIQKCHTRQEKMIKKVLSSVPHEFKMENSGIKPAIGGMIYLESACSFVRVESCHNEGEVYDLDNDKQRAAFVKEITKRLEDRVRRAKKSKAIASRKTFVGSYDGDTENTIQSAKFEVYLNPDQEINEADVSVVGKIKFFKKAPRTCMFDIEQRKIFTVDGNEEIEAANTGAVIDRLLECLANKE